jgi:AcrR family transcriptional regulator
MRADAVKNRRRILEAAEEVFAAQGVSVPIDMVAEKAGVGVGTLYRHFPTKEALFQAIVVMRIEELIEATRSAAGAPQAGEALFEYLQRFADTAAMKHDLFDALASAGIDLKARCSKSVEELEAGVGRLVDRAVASGEIRDDVSAKEIMGLVMGICMATNRSGLASGSRQQLVSVICDGLRPQQSSTPAS